MPPSLKQGKSVATSPHPRLTTPGPSESLATSPHPRLTAHNPVWSQWTEDLRGAEFADAIMLLQKPPTTHWQEPELDSVLTKAYLLRSAFHAAPSHLHHLQHS